MIEQVSTLDNKILINKTQIKYSKAYGCAYLMPIEYVIGIDTVLNNQELKNDIVCSILGLSNPIRARVVKVKRSEIGKQSLQILQITTLQIAEILTNQIVGTNFLGMDITNWTREAPLLPYLIKQATQDAVILVPNRIDQSIELIHILDNTPEHNIANFKITELITDQRPETGQNIATDKTSRKGKSNTKFMPQLPLNKLQGMTSKLLPTYQLKCKKLVDVQIGDQIKINDEIHKVIEHEQINFLGEVFVDIVVGLPCDFSNITNSPHDDTQANETFKRNIKKVDCSKYD